MMPSSIARTSRHPSCHRQSRPLISFDIMHDAIDPAAYATLTPISHPDCMRYPFVSAAAADACSAEANVTRNDFAPGLGVGWEEGGGADEGEAVEKPGYLIISYVQSTVVTYCEKRAPMIPSLHSGGRFVQMREVPAAPFACGNAGISTRLDAVTHHPHHPPSQSPSPLHHRRPS